MIGLAAVLTACTPAAKDTGAEVDPRGVNAPDPVFSPDDALAAIEAGTQHGLPDAIDLWHSYEALMALGDAVCPADETQLIDTNVPLSGCTAASGARYAGVSVVMTEAELGGGDPDRVVRLLGGDFTITDPDGRTMDFGGQVLWQGTGREGKLASFAQINGTMVYPGGSDWLAAGVSSVLELEVEDDGAARLSVYGGLGTEGVDLWFDRVTFAAEGDHAPSGAIGVHDPSGAWWTLTLSGDGSCGTLAYPARPDEEGCIDLAPLYASTVPMLETWP